MVVLHAIWAPELQRGLTRAWNCFQTYGSAIQRHAGGRQRATTPREERFRVMQARRYPFVNATTLRNEFGNAVGVNISTQTVRNRGLRSRKACIRISLTRHHNRRVWTGHKITATSRITIGILYSSPMTEDTVLTLQIDVLKYGEDMVSDFKMPASPNMTALVEAPSWCGWYQQRWKNRPAHRDERHDHRRTLQGGDHGRLRYTLRWCNRIPVHPHGRQRSTSSCQSG